jgi:uncharacterized protein YgiM (DUF1202 family)
MLAGVLIFVGLVLVAVEAGEQLFVQMREAQLRAAPGFLSPVRQTLDFGAEVTVLAERSGWYHVTATGSEQRGWVHATAVEENRSTQLRLQGETTTRTVTSREVALAGRGFSENLENEYGDERELDFTRVDALEDRAVEPDEIVSFVRSGGLREDFLTEVEE